MVVAINVDGSHPAPSANPSPTWLLEMGFGGVRMVSKPACERYAWACNHAGLAVLGVVTGESEGYVMPACTGLQIGNEPDAKETFFKAAEYADTWVLYRNTYPQFEGNVYMAGLASGGANAARYLRAVLRAIGDQAPLPDGVAVHPYNKTPDQAASDLDALARVTEDFAVGGIPLVVTEWFRDAGCGQIADFFAMLIGRAPTWSSWFCISDSMVPGFGLLSDDGREKDEYAQLSAAVQGWNAAVLSPSV
jgi:hypothetical protein